jgi:hypothetical protein
MSAWPKTPSSARSSPERVRSPAGSQERYQTEVESWRKLQSDNIEFVIEAAERTAEMSWSRRFDEPIELPNGKKLLTLKDAIAWSAIGAAFRYEKQGSRNQKLAMCRSRS